MTRLGLALNQKRFNSTSRVSGAAINMGATRGIGSTTRMFYYCRQHSEAPSECINQFINIQGQSNNTNNTQGWSTQAGKLLGANIQDLYNFATDINGIAADSKGNIYIGVNDYVSNTYFVKKWNGTTWSSLGTGLNSSLAAIAIDLNDNVYVGGVFTNYIAKWDGTNWSPLGSGLNDTVYSIVVDSNNNVYVGGDFYNVGSRIAKWNPNTNTWSALGTGVNSSVRAIAVDLNGNVYVGGFFTNAGGVTDTYYIAKWDGTNWSPLGSGLNDTVSAIAVDSNNNVYVGGAFSNAGGSSANYIAKWNPNTNTWSALGTGVNNYVYSIVVDSNNNVYAGGSFVYDGNEETQYFYTAKWNGTEWSKLDLGLSGYNYTDYSFVTGMVYFNNKIYMTGKMYGSNIAPYTNYSARVNLSNLSVTAVAGNNFNFEDGQFNAYAVDSLGNLYVGGDFSGTGNPGNRIAKWDPLANGGIGQWSALGSGLNEIVNTIAIDSANNVYVAGDFTNVGARIAKWDPLANGGIGQWSALGSGINGGGDVIAIDLNNNVYVGGFFTNAGGNPAIRIAKWNPNTNTWSALGSGIIGNVNAIAIDSANNVYVGGNFTNVGNNIAKWDGSNWSPLGSGLNDGVDAIAIDSANNVYVGGDFTEAGGNPASRIAKWDGSNWSALGSGLEGNAYNVPYVYSLAIDSTNNVYVGGDFAKAGGVLNNSNIAKWNPLGSGSWSNFNTYLGGSEVEKLYIKNQQLYISSSTLYNTDLSPGFIVWNI
jgi:hypothetical protein